MCDRWFCERHIEPRLAFIPDFNPTKYSPELEALYYKERKRVDGHPDLEYSRRKFAELDMEKRMQSKLIKQSLDRMNAHYKKKSASHSRMAKKDNRFSSQGDYHFKRRNTNHHKWHEKPKKSYSNYKRSFHIGWKTKKFLTSLKLWVPIFGVVLASLYLVEGDNPTLFYNSVPEPAKIAFYLLAIGVSAWIGYKIFDKFDTNPKSERGIFGLNILSGLMLMAGVFMLVFGIFYQSGFFTFPFYRPTLSLARNTFSIFLVVLSLAFLLISSYLMFKFQRRSGVIVYRR